MNRRTFLSGAAGAVSLGVAGSAAATASTMARVQDSGRKTVLTPSMEPERLDSLREVAPEVELVVCENAGAVRDAIADAHATYGFGSAELIRAGTKLQWLQWRSAGVEDIVFVPELAESDIILTNMQRIYAPQIADQTMAYLLAFQRGLPHCLQAQANGDWDQAREANAVLDDLQDKTMLILGLGGIGTEVARRAFGFGMKILATDPKVYEKPLFVAELHRPDAFHHLLPQADVLVSAVPLTPETRQMIGTREFGMMKDSAILINVSRGGVVDTDALIDALRSGQIAAAGLDVTDPEPLPKGHPLWNEHVIITPHSAGQTRRRDQLAFALFRENLRRFAAGEMLLNVVDKKVGY